MARYLLLVFFIATMASEATGVDFGLAPGVSVKNAMLYAAATAIAAESAIARNRRIEGLAFIAPFVLLILYAMFTWLVIVVLGDGLNYASVSTFIRLKVKLVDQLLVLLVFFYGVMNGRDALWLLRSLIWVGAVGCLITVVDTFDIPDLGLITTREDGRVEGITGSSQEFGALVAFLVPLFFAVWWTSTGASRAAALSSLALGLACIFLSASRGAMVGLLGGAFLATIYLRKTISAKTVLRASALGLALAAAMFAILLSTDFGEILGKRLTTGLGAGSAQAVSAGRTAIWLTALNNMAEHPWAFITGFGWEMYYQTPGYRLATHNVYLDRLYNLGIIGLGLFILVFTNALGCLRRALRKAPPSFAPLLIAGMLGLASFMIAMMFSDIHGAALYVWAYIGIMLRIAVTPVAQIQLVRESRSQPMTSLPT